MSNRLSAFRNSSPHRYGIHAQRSPLQRYGAGIAMVLLVHAGAIVAIKSGLEIRKLLHIDPPLIAKTIVIPPTIAEPIANVAPTLADFTLAQPQRPELPLPPPETITPPAKKDIATTGTPPARTEPVVTTVRIDPRHPLSQPGYPAQSRRLGEEGSVQLLVFVLPNGRVGEARVAVSSGFPRLDEAAVHEALRSWRFLPDSVDGVATGSWNRIGITFRLKN